VPATEFDPERVVRLLSEDVARTLGEQLLPQVRREAASVRALAEGLMGPTASFTAANDEDTDSAGYSLDEGQRFFNQKVVDDFQQFVHDTHLSAAWPPCPRHPNHPLEYSEETDAWHCRGDGALVASLGALAAVFR
jgi:hypothetical protein